MWAAAHGRFEKLGKLNWASPLEKTDNQAWSSSGDLLPTTVTENS